MAQPKLTAVICTHNRANFLKETLHAVLDQSLANGDFEILVVDNVSTDETSQFIQSFDSDQIRYIYEARLGLNHARNTGWQNVRSPYIAFLDDDAIPQEDWLEKILGCLERNPSIQILGGVVLPRWLEAVPLWLEPELYPALSLCEYRGEGDCFQLNFPGQYPIGANIVYAKQLLADLGGFADGFDRRGNLLLSGGESEFNMRAQDAGIPIWYCPHAIVYHTISADRLRRRFFRSRYYWSGRTWALLDASRFNHEYVFRQSIARILKGLSIDLARYFIFGFLQRHNPLLTEVYYREQLGYLVQAIRILSNTRVQVMV